MVELGNNITDADFHYFLSVFDNNDSFKLITIIEDISMAEFVSQYGQNVMPVLGISATNEIKPGKQIEQFNQDDVWVVIDTTKNRSGQNNNF